MADFNRIITAGTVVSRVLASLGLPVPSSPFGATDSTARQMVALLTECGQWLLDEYNWRILLKTQTITTTSETEYDVPEDLQRYIDSTTWNNTGRLPAIGPVSPQIWRMLEARQLGGTTLRLQYALRGSKFVLYFAPTPSQEIQVDYISRGWVQDPSDPDIRRDVPTQDADLILYQPDVIVNLLRYRWRDAKGLDSTSALGEFVRSMTRAKYNDKPHPDLKIGFQAGYPYLGYMNMPDTGYGS